MKTENNEKYLLQKNMRIRTKNILIMIIAMLFALVLFENTVQATNTSIINTGIKVKYHDKDPIELLYDENSKNNTYIDAEKIEDATVKIIINDLNKITIESLTDGAQIDYIEADNDLTINLSNSIKIGNDNTCIKCDGNLTIQYQGIIDYTFYMAGNVIAEKDLKINTNSRTLKIESYSKDGDAQFKSKNGDIIINYANIKIINVPDNVMFEAKEDITIKYSQIDVETYLGDYLIRSESGNVILDKSILRGKFGGTFIIYGNNINIQNNSTINLERGNKVEGRIYAEKNITIEGCQKYSIHAKKIETKAGKIIVDDNDNYTNVEFSKTPELKILNIGDVILDSNGDTTSTGSTSTGSTSTGDTSTGDTSIGDTSIGDTSTGNTPTDESNTEEETEELPDFSFEVVTENGDNKKITYEYWERYYVLDNENNLKHDADNYRAKTDTIESDENGKVIISIKKPEMSTVFIIINQHTPDGYYYVGNPAVLKFEYEEGKWKQKTSNFSFGQIDVSWISSPNDNPNNNGGIQWKEEADDNKNIGKLVIKNKKISTENIVFNIINSDDSYQKIAGSVFKVIGVTKDDILQSINNQNFGTKIKEMLEKKQDVNENKVEIATTAINEGEQTTVILIQESVPNNFEKLQYIILLTFKKENNQLQCTNIAKYDMSSNEYLKADNNLKYQDDSVIIIQKKLMTRGEYINKLYEDLAEKLDDVVADSIFSDVENYNYQQAITWAQNKDIINGNENNEFLPDEHITRKDAITILWRMEGKPEPEGKLTFGDVEENSYYEKAINWAIEEGITRGTDENTFLPDEKCTSKEAETFIDRYEHMTREAYIYKVWKKSNEPTTSEKHQFNDVDEYSKYYEAINWAYSKQYIIGTVNTNTEKRFEPSANITRGDAILVLYRLAGEPEITAKSFTDIEQSYYKNAINWAYSKGIAKGTGDSKFEPDRECTRAEANAFIERYFNLETEETFGLKVKALDGSDNVLENEEFYVGGKTFKLEDNKDYVNIEVPLTEAIKENGYFEITSSSIIKNQNSLTVHIEKNDDVWRYSSANRIINNKEDIFEIEYKEKSKTLYIKSSKATSEEAIKLNIEKQVSVEGNEEKYEVILEIEGGNILNNNKKEMKLNNTKTEIEIVPESKEDVSLIIYRNSKNEENLNKAGVALIYTNGENGWVPSLDADENSGVNYNNNTNTLSIEVD